MRTAYAMLGVVFMGIIIATYVLLATPAPEDEPQTEVSSQESN